MYEASIMKCIEMWHSGTGCSKVVANEPLEDGISCARSGYFISLLAMLVLLECISSIK